MGCISEIDENLRSDNEVTPKWEKGTKFWVTGTLVCLNPREEEKTDIPHVV